MTVLTASLRVLSYLGLWNLDHSTLSNLPATVRPHEPFENYQIDVPIGEYGPKVYETVLLDHEFGASWGQPFTVAYTPPTVADSHLYGFSEPIANFTHVTFTLEVSSFGIQYDRLAHIFLNGIELWRPSTSEPRGRRIHSQFTKDMSSFRALLSAPGNLSVELDNLVTDRLNGTFHVKLSAAYYEPTRPLSSNAWFEHEDLPADRITSMVDCTVATGAVVTEVGLVPYNTTRAVLHVFASGNGNDEFWYAESNRAREDNKLGPIRHIEVLIDGEMVGAVSPFYQVYTGGIQPALWSPLVAPNAYDGLAYHVDVSSSLPKLWGDKHRTLTLRVTNGKDRIVSHEWIVSAALLTWESPEWRGEGGAQQPVQQQNRSRLVSLPAIEVSTFSQTLITRADLRFRNIHTGELRVEEVETVVERKVEATLVGETVLSHKSKGLITTSYGARNYSINYHYDLALVLGDDSVAAAVGIETHEHVCSATDDLLSRIRNVHYNGSWYADPKEVAESAKHAKDWQLGDGSSGHDRKPRINGSDVFLKYRDPQRYGEVTHHQHAISRNGSLVSLNSPLDFNDDSVYLKDMLDTAEADIRGFPFVTPSEKELRERREIRRKWLHHSI